ncbi:MAG: hypothetical protein N3E51_03660 [Candidatus Micrarchaeota archaeon]|nr:hypothetical protein [Candidatus Micrarchaeota archaeon]
MGRKAGQAALDFLMTYGWALLLIALVAAALASLGTFDAISFVGSRASGFSQVSAEGWRVDSAGALTLKLKNNAGTDINITRINATYGTQTINYTAPLLLLNGEQSGTLPIGTFSGASAGGAYTVRIGITYTDMATGNSYIDSGVVSGRVG